MGVMHASGQQPAQSGQLFNRDIAVPCLAGGPLVDLYGDDAAARDFVVLFGIVCRLHAVQQEPNVRPSQRIS